MTQPITLTEVKHAYDAVRRAFTAYRGYREAAGAIVFEVQAARKEDENALPDGDAVSKVLGSVTVMGHRRKAAEEALKPILWHLHVLDKETVAHGYLRAESQAELVLKILEDAARWKWTGDQLRTYTTAVRERCSRVISGYPGDIADIEPALNKEQARLEERTVATGGDARYGYVLRKLKPQAQDFFELLMQNEGRVVPAHVVEERLWPGQVDIPVNRLNQAFFRMVEQVAELRVPGLIDRLEHVSGPQGGYLLKRPPT